MPALAALLMLVGIRTITPRDVVSVWRTGVARRIVLATTFALTMAIPLQYAVVAASDYRSRSLSSASRTTSVSNNGASPRTVTSSRPILPRTPRERRRRASAVRQPLLRRRPDLRSRASRGDAGVEEHCRDPAYTSAATLAPPSSRSFGGTRKAWRTSNRSWSSCHSMSHLQISSELLASPSSSGLRTCTGQPNE